MEIKEFGEIHALAKLLGKVKFEHDLDFYEFREFAMSPLIARVYERLFQEYTQLLKEKGHLENKPGFGKFKFESRDGETLKKRIEELTIGERDSIEKNGSVDSFLKILLSPMSYDQNEFALLKDHYEKSEGKPNYYIP